MNVAIALAIAYFVFGCLVASAFGKAASGSTRLTGDPDVSLPSENDDDGQGA